MIEIGSKPILWHIMKIYAAHSVNQLIIACGYKGYTVAEAWNFGPGSGSKRSVAELARTASGLWGTGACTDSVDGSKAA
jgi:NDP-sugar pyrophosphorylase family protein